MLFSFPDMTPLLDNDLSNLEENNIFIDDSSSVSAPRWDDCLCFPPDNPSEPTFALDKNNASVQSATRDTSHRASESSKTIVPGNFHDGDTSEHTLTFEGHFSCDEVDDKESTQNIPFMVVPELLQGHTDVPPSPSSANNEVPELRHADENVNNQHDDVVLQYPMSHNWACVDEDVFLGSRTIGTPGLELNLDNDTTREHPSIEEWVRGNRPILQDYADRQISLPVGPRLEVSVNEPSPSILAALKLLVNRDQEGCTDSSRRLGPQLIENFADIDRWAKEYLRSRHRTRVVDSEVTSLLTIVINNFYEAQVQLIDDLVTRALQNMQIGGRNNLGLEDFAIGFDFQMSQDLPFYVGETQSKFREPRPIRDVGPASEPVTTSSGRQVKPTQRARQGTNRSGRSDKGIVILQVKDQQPANGSAETTRQKDIAKPSSKHNFTKTPVRSAGATSPPHTMAVHTKYHPERPSNPGQSSILTISPPTMATAPARSNDNTKSVPSGPTSADRPRITYSSGSSTTLQASSRLTIRLPALNVPTLVPHTTTDAGPTVHKSDKLAANASATGPRGRRGRGARPRGPRNGGRGRGNRTAMVTVNAEPPEATPNGVDTLPMAHPVGVGNTAIPAILDAAAALRNFSLPPTSAAGTSASAQPRTEVAQDSNTDTRDEGTSTSQSTSADRSFASLADSGHPQEKKRKLDDYDD